MLAKGNEWKIMDNNRKLSGHRARGLIGAIHLPNNGIKMLSDGEFDSCTPSKLWMDD